MITDEYIFFWQGKLSNFYRTEIHYQGLHFHSSEQLFMYFKAKFFNDEYHARLILESKTPKESKLYGRKVVGFNNEEWDKVKCDFMYKALQAKFYGNKELSSYLTRKEHKNKLFVEASPYDKIWGIGIDENNPELLQTNFWGKNLLGQLLTKLHNEILNNN